tara:strand:+ start:2034 stop:2750 length:717 start_codon:yes stop_codon:yes gene_type:complete
MKKLLTERRLCELAGIREADTDELWKTRKDKKKRARHAAEKDFFGTDGDPIVTTDVPQVPEADPDATQALTPDQLKRIEKDVPNEARRPIAMELYKSLIEPNYTEDELEFMVTQHEEVADALSQLIGWFHPAFHDMRGTPTYDNPSRLGIKIAQEFEKEGLDIVEDAEEFSKRVEKHMHGEARAEFAANVAHRKPARNVKVGRSATPGTPEYDHLQKLFKKDAAAKAKGSAPTAAIKK